MAGQADLGAGPSAAAAAAATPDGLQHPGTDAQAQAVAELAARIELLEAELTKVNAAAPLALEAVQRWEAVAYFLDQRRVLQADNNTSLAWGQALSGPLQPWRQNLYPVW